MDSMKFCCACFQRELCFGPKYWSKKSANDENEPLALDEAEAAEAADGVEEPVADAAAGAAGGVAAGAMPSFFRLSTLVALGTV